MVQEATAPLFQQIAMLIEDSVVDGSLAEGERAPSMNELAAFHGVNPATARRGLMLLIQERVLQKRRGVGMFVAPGAREVARERRRRRFARDHLAPAVDEAARLGLSLAQLQELVGRVARSRGLYE